MSRSPPPLSLAPAEDIRKYLHSREGEPTTGRFGMYSSAIDDKEDAAWWQRRYAPDRAVLQDEGLLSDESDSERDGEDDAAPPAAGTLHVQRPPSSPHPSSPHPSSPLPSSPKPFGSPRLRASGVRTPTQAQRMVSYVTGRGGDNEE